MLPQLVLKETNPGARFFSGVVRISNEDYDTVVAVGTGKPFPSKPIEPTAMTLTGASAQPTPSRTDGAAAPPINLDLLFKTVEKLKQAAKLGGSLSEYDTRAEFIDKYLEALGYTELGDIQRGSPDDSGNFPDYVLHVNGKAAIAIEAKKLGTPLAAKEAGQVVAYCSASEPHLSGNI